jgi:hypothetical protein
VPIDVHAHYVPPQLIDSIDRTGSDIGVRLVSSESPTVNTGRTFTPPQVRPIQLISCGYSAWQRSQRLHLSRPLMKRRKPYWIKRFDQRGRGANIARDFTVMACWQSANARLRVAT